MGILVYHQLEELPGESSVAIGCFDGVHRGHREVISRAVKAGAEGLLPTAYTFDGQHMGGAGGKGAPALTTPETKLRLLESMGIQRVCQPEFGQVRGMSPETFVAEVLDGLLHAKVVCCGYNFHFGRGGAAHAETLRELCAQRGIRVEIAPEVRVDGLSVSSTAIRALLAEGYVEKANHLLGRRFGFAFPVTHGRQLGREMGAPTINQPFPDGFVRPKFGVYASVVQIDGENYCGVTNIGVKPTVGSDCVLAETWMPDYTGNLYGRSVPVELVQFLRPEMKFSGIAELRERILQDGRDACRIVKEKLSEETR